MPDARAVTRQPERPYSDALALRPQSERRRPEPYNASPNARTPLARARTPTPEPERPCRPGAVALTSDLNAFAETSLHSDARPLILGPIPASAPEA